MLADRQLWLGSDGKVEERERGGNGGLWWDVTELQGGSFFEAYSPEVHPMNKELSLSWGITYLHRGKEVMEQVGTGDE